jgi:hypothetical protein
MIKKIVLITALFISKNLEAQQLSSSIELNTPVDYYGYSPQIFNISNSEFLMVQRINGVIQLMKYDHSLNKTGLIEVKDHNLATNFIYNEVNDELLSFETTKTGKRKKETYTIISTQYNVKENSVSNKSLIIEKNEKYYKVINSKSGQYFALVHTPEKKYENPYEVIIYNSASHKKLRTVQYQLPKRADVDGINLSNQGQLIMTTLTGESKLIFHIYDKNGEQVKTVEKESVVDGKQYMHDIIFKDNDDSAIMSISYAYDDYELTGIQTFEIHLKTLVIEQIQSVTLDKDFVKNNLYQNTFEPYDAKWGNTPPIGEEGKNPKRLEGFRMTDFFYTSDQNIIYQLEEQEYKQLRKGNNIREFHIVKDLLLIAFDESKSFKYSTVVDKKIISESNYSFRNPFIPRYSGVQVISNITQDRLRILSKEMIGFSSFCVVNREIDLQTGKVTKMQPLFEDCDNNSINMYYTKWLAADKLVTTKMKGIEFVLKANKFNLQVIEF